MGEQGVVLGVEGRKSGLDLICGLGGPGAAGGEGPQAGGGAGAGAAGATGAKDDVVDAEFEEVKDKDRRAS